MGYGDLRRRFTVNMSSELSKGISFPKNRGFLRGLKTGQSVLLGNESGVSEKP